MIVIIAGVSGSGKTTVGTLLADRLGWRFADADREPWLRSIAAWMDERIAHGEAAVVGCSALKRSYRDELLGGRPEARMVFLATDRDVLTRRLAARVGHFFPEKLLASQLAALEPPGPDEHVIRVVPADTPAATVDAIIALLFPQGGDHEAEA